MSPEVKLRRLVKRISYQDEGQTISINYGIGSAGSPGVSRLDLRLETTANFRHELRIYSGNLGDTKAKLWGSSKADPYITFHADTYACLDNETLVCDMLDRISTARHPLEELEEKIEEFLTEQDYRFTESHSREHILDSRLPHR